MKAFEFRLKTLLDWRRRQREASEAQLEEMQREKRRLEQHRDELTAADFEARQQLASGNRIAPAELQAVANFGQHVAAMKVTLGRQIAACGQRAVRQRKVVAERRRDEELLIELEQKARADWNYEFNRELENLAGDAHLAALVRKRGRTVVKP